MKIALQFHLHFMPQTRQRQTPPGTWYHAVLFLSALLLASAHRAVANLGHRGGVCVDGCGHVHASRVKLWFRYLGGEQWMGCPGGPLPYRFYILKHISCNSTQSDMTYDTHEGYMKGNFESTV